MTLRSRGRHPLKRVCVLDVELLEDRRLLNGTQPVAQVTQPVAQVTQPVAQAVEQVTQPVAQVAQPVAQVTQPVAQVTQPVAQAVEQVTQPVAQVTQPVAQAVEQVTQPVAQAVEQVTQPVAQAVESVAQAVEQVTQPAALPDRRGQAVAQATQPAVQAVEPVPPAMVAGEALKNGDDLAPQPAALLGDRSRFDLKWLEQAVQQLFGKIDDLGEGLIGQTGKDLFACLMTVATATAAYEIARREMYRFRSEQDMTLTGP
jgi:uncharacterized protein YoxC